MWCRVEVERQHSLLRLRPDVGAAHVADGECRAVDQFAVHMELEHQGVTTCAATKPMPDKFLSRRRPTLARYGNGHQGQCTDHCRETSRTLSDARRGHLVSDAESVGCTTNSYSSINPISANASGSGRHAASIIS